MGKYDKVMEKILRGATDANIAFDDIRDLLLHLGFEERTRGSHHVADYRDNLGLQISSLIRFCSDSFQAKEKGSHFIVIVLTSAGL